MNIKTPLKTLQYNLFLTMLGDVLEISVKFLLRPGGLRTEISRTFT